MEAAVHIDVDLLHPLREGLELHRDTDEHAELISSHATQTSDRLRDGSGARGDRCFTEKRLRLVAHVLRHFTAAYDGVAIAVGEPPEEAEAAARRGEEGVTGARAGAFGGSRV